MLTFFLLSFTHSGDYPKKPEHPREAVKSALTPKFPGRPQTNDPIRFTLKADKQQIAVGEPLTITVVAHYLNISPALLFTTAGSNAFRLKVLLPEGFVQTGGDYVDYVGTELSAEKPTATYILKGYFTKAGSKNEFRLLRGHGLADANSLFVDKSRLNVTVTGNNIAHSNKGARSAGALAFQIVSYDCNSGVLQYQFTGGDGSPINVVLPGIFAGTMYSDNVSTHTFPGDARTGRSVSGNANQSGNQISVNFTTSCNLSSGGGNPPTSPNPPGNPNPPSGGSLAFQIVGYDCNSGVLQYQMTGGNGSPINLTLPGIFAGTINANNVSTHTFPSDARQGRSVNGYANQSGSQVSISFTTSCNLSSGNPNPPNNPNPPSTPNPPASGGSLAFQIMGYDCNSGVLQYQFTGGNGSPIDVVMPGIFAGTVNANNLATYTFPGDARTGRSMTGTATQGGNQISINFTTSCNLSSGQSNPPSNPNPPSSGCGTGNGLLGFYTNSTDLAQNPVTVRTDAQLNFTWGGSPVPGVVNEDGFSVRWFGQVEAPVSGNYTFKINNDDGTRLWINDQLLIDDWNGHGPTWMQGSIYLNAGQKYDITIDYVEYSGGAQMQLYWEYPGQGMQIVPSCRLYTNLRAPSSDPTGSSSSGVQCVYVTPCIDYVLDCNTGKIVDLVFYSCGPASNGNGGSGGGGGGDGGGGSGGGGTGSPTGGGGGIGMPGGPTTSGRPNFRLPIGQSAEEASRIKFYRDMAYRGITFTAEEIAVLNEFPNARANVRNHVDRYGTKPDGSNAFIMSLEDQQRYPRFANLVRSLPTIVANDTKVREAIMHFTGYSAGKVLDLLTVGRGPRILIQDVKSQYGNKAKGHCTCPGFPEWTVEIEISFVRGLEQANLKSTQQATAFLLAVTLLHEFTHWGAAQNNISEAGYEFGDSMEIMAFGTIITKNNAGNYDYRFFEK
ncbi:hypothetical protein IC229_11240 [Spirosoma sp. BT702]|uniref:PA14 domain-containing protein n=1 Tax=Spirosoma profusum TaxID=2771354 RepID=A0A926XV96_9BACT|nr:PA14 domain-containing protein [Spirosoma profusum]MBD2701213.1 hypothetical protein [Spirosoma profusum]